MLAQAGPPLCDDLNRIDELPDGSPIERVSALCLRGYMNNQLLRDIDAVSMAHSLEARAPYLDPVVVDFALSLPDCAKRHDVHNFSAPAYLTTYRDSGAKHILIDGGVGILPDDFDRPPKRGFVMPFEAWLRGPLRDVLEDTLSDEALRACGLLDVRAVAEVRDKCLAGQMGWTQPWLLMMLELWCREVLLFAATSPRSSPASGATRADTSTC